MYVLSLSLVWSWDPTPLGFPPPQKLHMMKQAALWSCVCAIVEDPPPPHVMGGWDAGPAR